MGAGRQRGSEKRGRSLINAARPRFIYSATAGARHSSHLDYLRRWLPRAAALVNQPPAEISISLVGAARIAALHKKFMDVDDATDVLTFELEQSENGKCHAGEIVLCVPFAKRESDRRGADINRELLLYALHGLLHLSGFDDLTESGYAKMHAEEDRILTAVGIGPVFSPNEKRES